VQAKIVCTGHLGALTGYNAAAGLIYCNVA